VRKGRRQVPVSEREVNKGCGLVHAPLTTF